MESGGMNGSGGGRRHRIIERLSTIRLHSGIIRRLARQPGELNRQELELQIDQIDRNVTEATRFVEEWPMTSH